MKIDLRRLNREPKIIINEKLTFENYDLKKCGIKELNNIIVTGEIYYSVADEITIDLSLTGDMIVYDSVTLEDITMLLNININELISENNQNTLDIEEILWQNIVLEVPIRITKEENPSLKGEGWELIEKNDEEI